MSVELSPMQQMAARLPSPSGCMCIQAPRRRRAHRVTGACELDMELMLSSGAIEPHQKRSLRTLVRDLITWLRASEP